MNFIWKENMARKLKLELIIFIFIFLRGLLFLTYRQNDWFTLAMSFCVLLALSILYTSLILSPPLFLRSFGAFLNIWRWHYKLFSSPLIFWVDLFSAYKANCGFIQGFGSSIFFLEKFESRALNLEWREIFLNSIEWLF